MFESLSNSLEIVKRSFAVLAEEKKLLIFPLISSIALIALVLSFILPAFMVINSDILTIVLIAIFYMLAYFVVIFFNSALVYATNCKLDGKNVSVMESISFSFGRIVPIIAWSAIAATVGLILSFLRGQASRQKGIGGLIASVVVSMIGMAWSLATFFVVPIIVFEGAGPLDAVKRSVVLIKKTWGEEITAGLGIGIIFLVLYLIGVGAIILSALTGIGFVIVLAIAIPYLLLVFLVQSTINSIFMLVLYRYATTGKSAIYEPEHLQGAFK